MLRDTSASTPTLDLSTTFPDTVTRMQVVDRHGVSQAVDLTRIVSVITSCCDGLPGADPMRIVTKTVSGLHDGVSTRALNLLSIDVAHGLTAEDPDYSRAAARLLARMIRRDVEDQGIHSFSQGIAAAFKLGLVDKSVRSFVRKHRDVLDNAIDLLGDIRFDYIGAKTVEDRYVLKHPQTRLPLETFQHWMMRVAVGTASTPEEAIEVYRMYNSFRYLSATPTLLNSGKTASQLSSCFVLDSPSDDLAGIYGSYTDIAFLSKWSGGIGISYSGVRSRGSYIKGTNGFSDGIVPWLRTLNASVAAVNQCFAPDTIIFTQRGPISIDKIGTADRVLGNSGEMRRVKKVFTYTQKEEMVQLDVKHSLRPLTVTDGHPIYAITGAPMGQTIARTLHALNEKKDIKPAWIKSGDLKPGDYIAQVIPTGMAPVEDLTEDDARLYGILLGDGWCDKGREGWGVAGGSEDQDHMRFTKKYLEKRGIHYWKTVTEGVARYNWSATTGSVRDEKTGRILTKDHGEPTLPFSRDDLYTSDGEKYISARMMYLPRPHALKMLRGLLETDGSVSRSKEIFFHTSSVPLAEGFRFQLLRLGVPCAGQYRVRKMNHAGTRKDGSTIRFNGTTVAIDLRVPAIPEIAKFMKVPALTKFNWFTHHGCVWTRLKTTKKVPSTGTVYDLEVKTDETYMTASALVHNGGVRKGACTVTLEPWHGDIEAFLELRDNTGDAALRTHDLNLAVWVPDLFMERVEANAQWSLFSPSDTPELPNLWGEKFKVAYEAYEAAGKARKTVSARALYQRMLRTLSTTGNGFICFKDRANATSNQTLKSENVIHSSNLCVAPETLLHTFEYGDKAISELKGQQVHVWNGQQYSLTTVVQTGTQAPLLTVTLARTLPSPDGLSDATENVVIHCTPYHKFLVSPVDRVEAKDLQAGQALRTFRVPNGTSYKLTVVSVEDEGRVDDTYCVNEPREHAAMFNGVLTGNCQEILEVNKTREECSVCNLASINLAAHIENGRFDFDKLVETAEVAVRQLDRVIDRNFYTIKETKASNSRWRPVGLGIMGLQDVFFALKMPFDSEPAKALSTQISECLYYTALRVSCILAQEEEPCAAFKETRLSQGVFSFEHWNLPAPVAPTDSKLSYDWEKLRSDIMTYGTRNSLLLAIAPTATIASIAGVYECIEPQTSNEFKRETMSGDFMQVNTALVRDLKARGLWTAEVRAELRKTEGSLQTCNVPDDLKALYRTVWEIPQRSLIDMAAARTPFIDQSTSLNLFIENPTMGKLSGMYMHAWKSGVKTTYYLRTRAATRTQKTVKGGAQPIEAPKQSEKIYSDDEALVCSIDNPKACEACQ